MERPNRFQSRSPGRKRNIKEISPNEAALELGCDAATLINLAEEKESGRKTREPRPTSRGRVRFETHLANERIDDRRQDREKARKALA
jgi:hypothetical protein